MFPCKGSSIKFNSNTLIPKLPGVGKLYHLRSNLSVCLHSLCKIDGSHSMWKGEYFSQNISQRTRYILKTFKSCTTSFNCERKKLKAQDSCFVPSYTVLLKKSIIITVFIVCFHVLERVSDTSSCHTCCVVEAGFNGVYACIYACRFPWSREERSWI